jgi:hypothetical protein
MRRIKWICAAIANAYVKALLRAAAINWGIVKRSTFALAHMDLLLFAVW